MSVMFPAHDCSESYYDSIIPYTDLSSIYCRREIVKDIDTHTRRQVIYDQ